MPKNGNKSTEGNAIPTLAEYITTQIANKRSASLSKSRNRTMPAIPIINGTPNRNSCIYTATDNYGNQYRVPGNWTFYENPGKYGFKPVSLDQAVPGDIIQVFDKGAPYHAMTLDSFDEQGRMKYNYSRGSSGDESDIVKASINFPNTKKAAYTFVGTQADSTQWTNDYKKLYGNQMKCGGRRKAQLGLDIREGGIAIPIANNMWYIHGRKHEYGGVTMGPNNKNGVEVEGGEVVEMIDSNHPSVGRQFKAGGQNQTMRVFSSVPLLRGVSPAELVMGGANPNKVFKAQEDFKDRNRINDDGTHYQNGGNKVIKYENLPSSFKGKRVNGRILQGGVPPVVSRGEFAMGNPLQRMSMWNDDLGEFSKYMARRIHKFIPKKVDKVYRHIVGYLSDKGPNNAIDNNAENLTKAISLFNAHEYKSGGIYIKPSKRGTFTAAATKHGMGVQGFANKVLANKEDYSTAMVKKANFARNASRWKKEYGGDGNVLPEVVVTGKKPKTFFEKLDDYADIGEKALAVPNLALSGASLISPNPITLGGAYLTNIGGALLDLYQGGRAVYKGDWFNAGKNVIDLGLSLVGLRALRNANKLNELDKSLDASSAAREYVSKYVGRGRGKRKATFTKEKNEAITQEAIGYGSIPAGTAFSMLDTNRNKKEYGGNMLYTINGNVKNGLMASRPKAQYGKQTIIRNNKEWEYDEKFGAFVPVKDVTKYKTIADRTYKKEPNSKNYVEVIDSVEKAKLNKPKKVIVKQNNKSESNKESPAKENKYVSTTKFNTGESYIINPLTGEWIRNGITETSEPSVKGTTKVSSKPSSTTRGEGTQSTATSRGTAKVESPKSTTATNPMEARYASRVQKGQAQEVTTQPSVEYNETVDKNPDKNRYTRAAGFKAGEVPASPGNNQKEKDDEKAKDTRLIGQYKTFRPEDWLGLGTNLAGHIAGYFANNSLLKKYPMPVKPVLFQASKLKTTHNINSKLATNRETEQMNLAEVGRNTSSSSTSIARKQRIMNEARDARNKLYAEKENIETQLINLDRRNRQDVLNRNIAAFNDWLDKTYIAKTNKLLEKQKNMMSLINGMPSAVNHTLGVIESRRNTNNTLRAIAAANPNVDARQIGGFDYYEGIGPDGTHKALYDKHQRFVRYI